MNRRQYKRRRARRNHHAHASRTPDLPQLLINGGDSPRVEDGHIVPRTYQRPWENSARQVTVHRVGHVGHKLESTKNVATRGPFYRRSRPGSGIVIDDIEASLAHMENKSTPALRQVRSGGRLTEERKAALAQLFAAQILRGPIFGQAYEEASRSVVESAGRKSFKRDHLAAVDGNLEAARREVTDVLLNPTNRLVTMLTYVPKVAGILGLMRWNIFRFERPLLAYSDHPVVVWPMDVALTRPFASQALGPLGALEIRVPIAPDSAIVMNWIDRSDIDRLRGTRWVAAQLNAFTVSQAEREWMHRLGAEPPRAEDIFAPLSKLVDPRYDRASCLGSARRAHAIRFAEKASKRRWVNKLEVLVEIGRAASKAT